MALEQAYWNQQQAAGSWTVQPGLLHPVNQQLPSSRLFINHALLSYHAKFAHGSTSHSVRDVELEEKDTDGGDKVQLDDLTDRVIVWLTSTTTFYTPIHAPATYANMHVTCV